MLKSLDTIAEKLGDIIIKTNKTIQIKKPNIALVIQYSEPQKLKVIAQQNANVSIGVSIVSSDNSGYQYIDKDDRRNGSDHLVLATSVVPSEVFANKSQAIFSYLFGDDTLFQENHFKSDTLETDVDLQSRLISKVLAITVGKTKIENLSYPIQLKFKKINDKDIAVKEGYEEENVCSFWKIDKRKIYKFSIVKIYSLTVQATLACG
jgi:hypothetical protein